MANPRPQHELDSLALEAAMKINCHLEWRANKHTRRLLQDNQCSVLMGRSRGDESDIAFVMVFYQEHAHFIYSDVECFLIAGRGYKDEMEVAAVRYGHVHARQQLAHRINGAS